MLQLLNPHLASEVGWLYIDNIYFVYNLTSTYAAAPTDSTVDDTVMTKTDYSNTDDRTVFVSNLSYETTEQQLNDIFSLVNI